MSNTAQADFKWITSENPKEFAYIAVDTQLRLYFNAATRQLLGIKPIRESTVPVNIGYDFANKRLVVADPNIVRPVNVKPHRIDKRGYSSARPFIKAVGLHKQDLPLRYIYLGKDYGGGMYPKGSFVFGVEGEVGEDGAL